MYRQCSCLEQVLCVFFRIDRLLLNLAEINVVYVCFTINKIIKQHNIIFPRTCPSTEIAFRKCVERFVSPTKKYHTKINQKHFYSDNKITCTHLRSGYVVLEVIVFI